MPKRTRYCEFYEKYSDGETHTQYKTAVPNQDWYLGFRKNGKPMKGTRRRKKDKSCINFQKDPNKKQNMCIVQNGIYPPLNICKPLFKVNKVRHSESHRRRRSDRPKGESHEQHRSDRPNGESHRQNRLDRPNG